MSLLWLALVLLSIPAALWLLRRSGWGGLRSGLRPPADAGAVADPAGASAAPGAVEVGEGLERCRVLLGVTAQQVSVLHRIACRSGRCLPATDALPVDATFRRLLEGWRRRAGAARPRERSCELNRRSPSGPGWTPRLAPLCRCPRCWPPRRCWRCHAGHAGQGLPIVVGQGSGGSTYSVPVQTLLILTSCPSCRRC